MPKNQISKSPKIIETAFERVRRAKDVGVTGIKTLKVPRDQELVLEAIIGKNGRTETMNAADLPLGSNITRTFSEAMIAKRASWPPGTKACHITIAMDAGVTTDRTPTPDIEMLCRIMAIAMRITKLHGIGKVEVHPLVNYPGGGLGRTLLWHVHIIAWTDQSFDVGVATRLIAGIPEMVCSFGAKPVLIKLIQDTEADMQRVCEYITKPFSAKRLKRKKDKPDSVKLKNTLKIRPEFALRVSEGLSQINPFDLFKGFGEGRAIVTEVRKQVSAWHRARKVTGLVLPRTFDVWAFWDKLRAEHGSKLYRPYRFSVAALRGPWRRRSRTPTRPGGPRKRPAILRAQKRAEFNIDDL